MPAGVSTLCLVEKCTVRIHDKYYVIFINEFALSYLARCILCSCNKLGRYKSAMRSETSSSAVSCGGVCSVFENFLKDNKHLVKVKP